jgi:hypothetical protein
VLKTPICGLLHPEGGRNTLLRRVGNYQATQSNIPEDRILHSYMTHGSSVTTAQHDIAVAAHEQTAAVTINDCGRCDNRKAAVIF